MTLAESTAISRSSNGTVGNAGNAHETIKSWKLVKIYLFIIIFFHLQIHRSKNKWKFHLKDGIMNLNGRDYVFSKAIGDAEW